MPDYKSENKAFLYTRKMLSLCSLIFLMLFFQNCGISEDSPLDDITLAEQAEADAMPFAFDVTVDHIAYMSCDSDSVNQNGKLFNFKAGAYGDDEGIKIRSNFRSFVAGRSKNYVLRRLANSRRNRGAGVVMSIREGGQFQGPVRIGGGSGGEDIDFGNIISPMIWNPLSNVQYTQYTGEETDLSAYLWDRPNGVNYLEGFSGLNGKSFEGEISYNAQGAQQIIRDSVESDAYLTFTFATEDLEALGEQARAPSSESGNSTSANSSVWGKGYRMTFSQVNPTRPGSPRRALSSVTGFNLENELSLDESWSCPQSERYIIIKDMADALRRYDAAPFNRGTGADTVANNPWDDEYDPGPETQGGYMMNVMITDSEDIDDDGDSNELISVRRKVICPPIPDNIPIGSSEHEIGAWTRIRNILPSEDWYVFRGPRYNCVIPKQTNNACYGEFEANQGGQNAPVIQYLPDEDMPEFWIARQEADIEAGTVDTVVVRETECEGATTGLRLCPQVISVCHKQ